ncbi:MAG: DUF3341 domain-containing protein [Bryobacterales bacterium]|nr:DUF3341 domain-containing protein [Bryobacterales bacterium]
MEYVHAEFLRGEDAAAAIGDLAALGVPRSAIEIYSLRPLELDPAPLARRSRMSLIAVLSAITVGGGATALVYWAQRDYPLITGGMPINSGWATGVVTFETTMAGAVMGIFAALLWESGLIRKRKRVPVPSLPDEGVVLQVAGVRDRAEIQESLHAAGAISVEIVGNKR